MQILNVFLFNILSAFPFILFVVFFSFWFGTCKSSWITSKQTAKTIYINNKYLREFTKKEFIYIIKLQVVLLND